MDRTIEVVETLRERRIHLTAQWPSDGDVTALVADDDVFATVLPALLIANKSDLIEDPGGELEVLEELSGVDFPTLAVSAETGEGLENLGEWLFEHLGIVRVYTKLPGEEPDRGEPFTIHKGQTVHDVATQIHKDVAANLKYARVWGAESFDGQQVGRDHVLVDGDVIELH